MPCLKVGARETANRGGNGNWQWQRVVATSMVKAMAKMQCWQRMPSTKMASSKKKRWQAAWQGPWKKQRAGKHCKKGGAAKKKCCNCSKAHVNSLFCLHPHRFSRSMSIGDQFTDQFLSLVWDLRAESVAMPLRRNTRKHIHRLHHALNGLVFFNFWFRWLLHGSNCGQQHSHQNWTSKSRAPTAHKHALRSQEEQHCQWSVKYNIYCVVILQNSNERNRVYVYCILSNITLHWKGWLQLNVSWLASSAFPAKLAMLAQL